MLRSTNGSTQKAEGKRAFGTRAVTAVLDVQGCTMQVHVWLTRALATAHCHRCHPAPPRLQCACASVHVHDERDRRQGKTRTATKTASAEVLGGWGGKCCLPATRNWNEHQNLTNGGHGKLEPSARAPSFAVPCPGPQDRQLPCSLSEQPWNLNCAIPLFSHQQ